VLVVAVLIEHGLGGAGDELLDVTAVLVEAVAVLVGQLLRLSARRAGRTAS
jgi:hypothetical protein